MHMSSHHKFSLKLDEEVFKHLQPDGFCAALKMFHSFTGYDILSAFGGRGRRQHGIPGRHTKSVPTFCALTSTLFLQTI